MTDKTPQAAPGAPAKARALKPRDAATLIIVDDTSGEPRILPLPTGEVRYRERLGGLLRHYHRHAA